MIDIIIQDYTNLGTRISSSRNFLLFSLRRHTDFNKLKPSLASEIFDKMISPILTYNSEVWGAFVKSDFQSWDMG